MSALYLLYSYRQITGVILTVSSWGQKIICLLHADFYQKPCTHFWVVQVLFFQKLHSMCDFFHFLCTRVYYIFNHLLNCSQTQRLRTSQTTPSLLLCLTQKKRQRKKKKKNQTDKYTVRYRYRRDDSKAVCRRAFKSSARSSNKCEIAQVC